MDAAEAFGTTGDIDVLFTDEFSNAAAAIYPTFEEGCGIPVVEALLTDYAFGGIPATLDVGPYRIRRAQQERGRRSPGASPHLGQRR